MGGASKLSLDGVMGILIQAPRVLVKRSMHAIFGTPKQKRHLAESLTADASRQGVPELFCT